VPIRAMRQPSAPLLVALFVLAGVRPLNGQLSIPADSAARDVMATVRSLRCTFDTGAGVWYGTGTERDTKPPLELKPLAAR
jgi:hypothetical protein